MKTKILAAGIICLCFFSACKTGTAPAPRVVVAPTGTATAGQLAAQQAAIDALKTEAATARELAQRAAGGVYGGLEANGHNPDGLPKEAVAAQLAEASSALPEPTAEQKLAKAGQNARMLAGELATVKAEMGQQISENQALRATLAAAEQRAAAAEAEALALKAAGEKERAEAAARLQRQFDDFTRRIESEQRKAAEAADAARKAAIQRLGYVLLGLGAILTLAGAAIAFVTKGLEWQRAAIAGAFGALCFGLYWTMNQPWFKWAVIGTLVCGVAAGVWWLAQERKTTIRQKEADEAEDTLKRIIAAVDALGEGATVKDVRAAIGNDMGDNNKALIHELRAETKRNAA
jgi:hypothetical protein